MVDGMVKSADKKDACTHHKRAYFRFLLILGVTIAHELTHCFMNYLSGDETKDTPTKLGDFKFPSSDCGDSGRVWEMKVLGGTLKTYEEKGNPMGDSQAGRVWIDNHNGYAKEILIEAEEVGRLGWVDISLYTAPRREMAEFEKHFTLMQDLRQRILKEAEEAGEKIKPRDTRGRRVRIRSQKAMPVPGTTPQGSGNRGEANTSTPTTTVRPVGKVVTGSPVGTKRPTPPRQPTPTTRSSASPTATRTPPAPHLSSSGSGRPSPPPAATAKPSSSSSPAPSTSTTSSTGTPAAPTPARAPGKAGPSTVARTSSPSVATATPTSYSSPVKPSSSTTSTKYSTGAPAARPPARGPSKAGSSPAVGSSRGPRLALVIPS